jgi:hypothetical protein
VTSGLDYFETHELIDIDHSLGERASVEAHADESNASAIEAAVAKALQAICTLLDGIEHARTRQ